MDVELPDTIDSAIIVKTYRNIQKLTPTPYRHQCPVSRLLVKFVK